MEKTRYMISDAAHLTQVEAHVLRYWEDELGLFVPRNELGHRYYTEENIREFRRIKELKEKGYQLKTIRGLIHGEKADQKKTVFLLEPETVRPESIRSETVRPEAAEDQQLPEQSPVASVEQTRNSEPQVRENRESFHVRSTEQQAGERMEKFRLLMRELVGQAIAENNEALSRQISRVVEDQVLKEMDYLVREQEESSRERYLKLDEALRAAAGRRGTVLSQDSLSRRELKKLQRQERREERKIKKVQKKNGR